MPRPRKIDNKLSSKALQIAIAVLKKKHPNKKFSASLIKKMLYIDNNVDSIEYAMQQLELPVKEGVDTSYRAQKSRNNEASLSTEEVHIGVVDMTRSGAAYIISEEREDDIFVQGKYLNTALNHDKVKVRLFSGTGRRRPEGKIVAVLERNTSRFIGTYHQKGKMGVVIPEQVSFPFDVQVNPEDAQGATSKDKVVFEVLEWPKKDFLPAKARVSTILGKEGGINLVMNSILINNGFNIAFPDEVEAEVENMPDEITKEDIKTRRDFRQITTFTIDPEDAKDFDDALSYNVLENGNIEVGIHIADVSFYVQKGTALDKEAISRSTSVYLADRVCPMLPEKISNELCSLRPNEDKRTYSAVFTFDTNNKIVDRWFGRTLIHSDKRFSYEQAQAILDTKEGELSVELLKLNDIAYYLRKRRYQHGSISFESDEVRFRFDENGHPVEAFIKNRGDANLLIEDFMLLANREVATFMHNKDKVNPIPFVYRIHDIPSIDKLTDLALFAKELGFNFNLDTPKTIIESYNRLSEAAKENEALKLLEPLAIRTMSKAEYSPNNIGHYGLGFEYYTHFTSPIRRYSDILVHRILDKNLTMVYREDKAILEGMCKHISKMERCAMDAERESVKYFQALYLNDKIGEEFDGVISGIMDRGIFVELIENKCEGLVAFDGLYETFEVESSRLKAVGKRTKRVFKMGDHVRVKILDVDVALKQINMELVEA
ncbi:MAG TPA: ribonuclease R [Saprospiraceae bacterium]|nr:ribonuclease R [Saprospiraceae bacterium]